MASTFRHTRATSLPANGSRSRQRAFNFAFARVSLGRCCDHDANYVNNFNRAIAAGIPIGPYAVGYPHTNMGDPNDAVNEANYLDFIDEARTTRALV